MVDVEFFSNLKSGKNRKDRRRLKKFSSIIGDNGTVHVTGGSDDYLADLEDKVMQACKYKPEVFAIDGGDGTVSSVLASLERHWRGGSYPLVTVLKGGTYDLLARKLKVDNPFEHLKNIVQSDDVDQLRVQGIKMMRVHDDSNNEHLAFSSGVGFPVELLEEAYKKKHMKFLRISWMAMKALGSALINGEYYHQFNKKQNLLVTSKGHKGEIEQEESWLGIMAQTINTLGIPKYLPQPRIFRNAETEGRFHGVGVTMDFRKFLMYFPAVYAGETVHYKDREVGEIKPVLALDKQLKSMKIESDKPFKYQYSGELEFNNKPCLTRELYMDAGKTFDFIEKTVPTNGNSKHKT